jgi:hypothetical protein
MAQKYLTSPKNIVLLAITFASFVFGVIEQYCYPGVLFPPTMMASTLMSVVLIFAWYRFDAEEMAYKRSRWLNIGVVALGFLALPYYFFRSRGAKRGFIAVGNMILVFVVSVGSSAAGQYFASFGLQD